MDRLDPYRCAKDLLEAHGPQLAWQAAARKAVDAILDQDACGAWMRILEVLEELTRSELAKGEHLQ